MTELKVRRKEQNRETNQTSQPAQDVPHIDPELMKQKLQELREHFNSNYHVK